MTPNKLERLSFFLELESKLRSKLISFLPSDYYIFLYSIGRNFILNQIKKTDYQSLPPIPVVSNPVKLKNLTFRNDLGNAAGLDKDGDLLPFNYYLGAGFAIVGTVLARPHKGNLFRFGPWETNVWTPLPHSLSAINSLGLPSKGIDVALKNIDNFKRDYEPVDFPIGISLMAHPSDNIALQIEGVKTSIQKSAGIVDFIELNESCPNVEHEKAKDDFERRLTEYISCRNQYAPNLPLMIKIKDANNQKFLLKIINQLNIEGLVCFNTQTNYQELRKKIVTKDQKIFDHYTKKYKGGVSGKIISEQNLEGLKKIKTELSSIKSNIPLVHVGGIENYQDIESSRKVALLRQWYTGLMEKITNEKMKEIYSSVLQSTINNQQPIKHNQ